MRRPKRGAVPQAATGLSAAREEAERLASCERRVTQRIWAERKIVSLQNYVSCVDDCFIVSFYVIKLGGTVIKAGSYKGSHYQKFSLTNSSYTLKSDGTLCLRGGGLVADDFLDLFNSDFFLKFQNFFEREAYTICNNFR